MYQNFADNFLLLNKCYSHKGFAKYVIVTYRNWVLVCAK